MCVLLAPLVSPARAQTVPLSLVSETVADSRIPSKVRYSAAGAAAAQRSRGRL